MPLAVRQASPLYEFEGLKEESIPTLCPIDKILDEGNCGNGNAGVSGAIHRGEEARECVGKLTENRRQPHSRQSCVEFPTKSAHDLRASFAQRCVHSGMSPYELQRLMRHADIKTTLSRYATDNPYLNQVVKDRSQEKGISTTFGITFGITSK